MGGERKPEVTLATEREIADKHKVLAPFNGDFFNFYHRRTTH